LASEIVAKSNGSPDRTPLTAKEHSTFCTDI
jgi:hypothetical protein